MTQPWRHMASNMQSVTSVNYVIRDLLPVIVTRSWRKVSVKQYVTSVRDVICDVHTWWRHAWPISCYRDTIVTSSERQAVRCDVACDVTRDDVTRDLLPVVMTSIIVGVKQYVGAPIDCWCPAQFTQSHVDYTNVICWVNRWLWLLMVLLLN